MTDATVFYQRYPIDVRSDGPAARGAGVYRIRIMTGAVARDGHVIEPLGMQVANYLRNPVVLWTHDRLGVTPSGGLPIGRTLALERGPAGIDVEFEFLPGDAFAQRVRNAWDRGFLRAASVGWRAIRFEPRKSAEEGADAPPGLRFTETELLEWSLVPLPADPGAVAPERGCMEVYAAGLRALGFGELTETGRDAGLARFVDAAEELKEAMAPLIRLAGRRV